MNIVQNTNTDNKGNLYYNSYFNKQGAEAISCVNGKNHIFKGVPKIVLRRGQNSKFGNQLILQFLIKHIDIKYNASSPHNVLEYYFEEAEGLKFLKETIKYIEDGINERGLNKK